MQPRNPITPNTNQTSLNNTNMSTQRGPTKIGATSSHTSSACAACKYQRKKCSSDCLLAPYFPPTHQTQFLNAHKLFGVSNLLKIIRSLNDPIEKQEAMRTMIIQAEYRANDPVGGCYRLICDLQRKIKLHEAELAFVLNQLALYRAQGVVGEQHHHEIIMNHQNILRVPPLNVYSNHINHQHLIQQVHDNQDDDQQQQEYYNMIQDNNQLVLHHDDEVALNQLWTMETFGNNHDGGVNMMKPSSSSTMVDHKLLQQQQQQAESFVDQEVR
ncbi:hypothetical protein BVC80_695g2 [Macleaya cordata]|uniref:LOB domain-containing protein n=1 Tax=Macleaya cordata TaxID=56857 RepID=A0A200Q0K3_MACCD|nr:hypothetical protein BVC80_695g2 [Macleaya cordata]